MEYKRPMIIQILSGINKFNESVAENFYKSEQAFFSLGYCISSETFHSFYRDRCHNCSGFSREKININCYDFSYFRNHFKNGFLDVLLNTINDWPRKNYFPYEFNNVINSLSEHKNLVDLYLVWSKMSENEKIDDYLEVDFLQNEYKKKQKELQDLESFFH